MVDILKRVQHLIALAASPELEEARTSAYMAFALIREHKLVISISHAADDRQRPATQSPSSRDRATPSGYRDPFTATGTKPKGRNVHVCRGCLKVEIDWAELYCSGCQERRTRERRRREDVAAEEWMRGMNGALHDILNDFGQRSRHRDAGPFERPPKKPKAQKIKVDYDKLWFIECATCGLQSPTAKSSEEADVKALEFGFRIVEGKAMCPGCIYKYDERMGTKTP